MNTKSFVALLIVLGLVWILLVWGVSSWLSPDLPEPVSATESSSLQEEAP